MKNNINNSSNDDRNVITIDTTVGFVLNMMWNQTNWQSMRSKTIANNYNLKTSFIMGNTCGCVDPAEKDAEVKVENRTQNNAHRQQQIHNYRDSTLSK